MKTATLLGAMAFLIGMSSLAKAQDGNPFKYTIHGNFIDGEPDSSYTAYGIPPTAHLQIGAATVFTVTNTATRQRHAASYYSVFTYLKRSAGAGPFVLPAPPPAAQSAQKHDELDLAPNQTVTYSLQFICGGGVDTGSYEADYTFVIQDAKTEDAAVSTGTKAVSVHVSVQ